MNTSAAEREPLARYGRLEMSYIGTKCFQTEHEAEERNELQTAPTVFGLLKQ